MVGVPVRLRDAQTMDDLGVAHAPPPVLPGDVLCLEHGPLYRVVAIVMSAPGSELVPAFVGDEARCRQSARFIFALFLPVTPLSVTTWVPAAGSSPAPQGGGPRAWAV